MKFRYEFDIKKLPWPIEHGHQLMLVGSCFTENMGEKLRKYKFHTLENPNGILFNPVSVADAIISYIDKETYTANNLFCLNESWHSWKHHSRFSGAKPEEALQKINTSVEKANRFLKQADYLILTLGSSWIYTLTDKAVNGKVGSVAANNHKAPSDWFYRRLMTNEEVLSVLDTMLHRLFYFNPKIKILFTISPVRHLREGVVENNRSKAVLIQAVHHLVDKFDNIYYFPAYELVLDDLRDYRFFAEDLVHPNYFATQYVWEKFISACTTEKTRQLIERLHDILLAFQHRPFNAETIQHRKFLQNYFEKTTALKALHPEINLESEITYFANGGK